MARHLVSIRSRGHRRAALVATALLATGALSSCGFEYATDQIYNASVGTNHRTGPVDILSAVVVSSADGQGTFVATFNNNSLTASDTVTAVVAGPGDPDLQVTGFTPLDLSPNAFLNIADTERIKVAGDFIAGDYVDLTVQLQSAEAVDMTVPVVAATGEYEGLDVTATEGPGEGPSPALTEAPSPAASPTASESAAPAE